MTRAWLGTVRVTLMAVATWVAACGDDGSGSIDGGGDGGGSLDAAPHDGGGRDARPGDAGRGDARTEDGGPAEAGMRDGSTADGSVDGGAADGATADGAIDGGGADGAMDGGATDGGATDGGATDGGATDGGATDGGAFDGGGMGDGGLDGSVATDGGTADGGFADGGTPGADAFRIVSLELVDPHVWAEFAGTCSDVTSTANTSASNEIGTLDLNIVQIFRPLDQDLMSNDWDLVDEATCTAAVPDDQCTRPAAAPVTMATAELFSSGSECFMADGTVLNASYAAPNEPAPPCYVAAPGMLPLNLLGTTIPLSDAKVAATFSGGTPPTMLIDGIIVGYLTVADAMSTIIQEGVLAGDTLYEHLAHGRATGSACESVNTFSVDDSDPADGRDGFWVHLNFTAEPVEWTDP